MFGRPPAAIASSNRGEWEDERWARHVPSSFWFAAEVLKDRMWREYRDDAVHILSERSVIRVSIGWPSSM